MRCSMPRRTGYAMLAAMSATRRAGTPALAITSAVLKRKAGEVTLKVPKLRRQTFETAIIERYRRREASVEEALIEMYLAGGFGAAG